MRVRRSDLKGQVRAPPSKSHTHRAVFMAAMADGRSVISDPLLSADTMASCRAMRHMGAEVECGDSSITIVGGLECRGGEIDVGNSGTTLRLLAGTASLFPCPTVIDGDESLRSRPMGPLLDCLDSMGARCTSRGGKPPVTVEGPLTGRRASIRGDVSSQYISSLLMAGGLREGGMRVEVTGRLASRPYVDITVDLMRRFGSLVAETEGGYEAEGGGYAPCDYRVPGDFSSAAFPLVAGALCGDVAVYGLDLEDLQGDKAILDILRAFGAEVEADGGRARSSASKLRGARVDMGDVPDLFPAVAVLAANAEGESRLHNARQLRFKESDRIATTVAMLRSMGADIEAAEDGCVVRGGRRLRGAKVETHGDHRIMMAAFVAGLSADGVTEIDAKGEHQVSYPMFLNQMRSIGAVFEEDDDEQHG